MKTFHIGPIRPPSEADSLLLQVTNGCTWNRCKFCQLYRHTAFKAYTVDNIKKDIDTMAEIADIVYTCRNREGRWELEQLNRIIQDMPEMEQNSFYTVANWLVNGGETVFLQDGNTLALSGGRLTEVLRYLRETFPQIKRVTSYGRAENLSKVSAEEFAELKEAGLDRIHSGYESGSDKVLQMVNKGVTSEQQIQAGQNIKAGGLELSVYFMPGLGGKELSRENADGMAQVLSEINADFVRIRTSVLKEGTELYQDYREGRFTLCSEEEKVREIRNLILETRSVDTRLVSDHIVNLLQAVKGSLASEKEKMIRIIDEYLNLPERDRKLFQLARRQGRVISIKQMYRLPEAQRQQMESLIGQVTEEKEWNEMINRMMERFI